MRRILNKKRIVSLMVAAVLLCSLLIPSVSALAEYSKDNPYSQYYINENTDYVDLVLSNLSFAIKDNMSGVEIVKSKSDNLSGASTDDSNEDSLLGKRNTDETMTSESGSDNYSVDLIKTVTGNDGEGDYYSHNLYIHDEAGLLSRSEKESLLKDMEPLAKYGEVVFFSTNHNPIGNTSLFSESVFYDYFKFYDGQNATLFMIDMDCREVYIYSDGEFLRTVSRSKLTTITDNVYTYAGSEEYYLCASKAFEQINAVMEGKRIPETMKVVCNILIALNFGFFICYIIAAKTSKSDSSASMAMGYAKIQLQSRNPFSKLTRTTKTYIPPASSSGGGSRGGGGGHSGGGGGHSGGGAGHRF